MGLQYINIYGVGKIKNVEYIVFEARLNESVEGRTVTGLSTKRMLFIQFWVSNGNHGIRVGFP